MAKFNKVLFKENKGKGNIVFSPINTYEMITSIAAGTADIARDELCDLLGVSCNIKWVLSDTSAFHGITWAESMA